MITDRHARWWTGRLRGWLMGGLAACVLSAGCGETEEPGRLARRDTTVAEVPESVMAVARAQLPEINFDEAWANVDSAGELNSYEIRGRAANGKIREVRIAPDGRILEME